MRKGEVLAYKLARPDGFDFYTGKMVQYRGEFPHVVKPPNADAKLGICSSGVLHASSNPNDCFVGAKMPCSAYRVRGIPACGNAEKWGFTELAILEEITDLDKLFGWRYSEVINPIHPFKLPKRIPTDEDMALLKQWATVRASVGASVGATVGDSVGATVRDSVGDSVWATVRASVGDSVGDSVWATVWASVWDTVRASVGATVRDSVWATVRATVWDTVWAYIGSLFPGVTKWKYINHKKCAYPFQSGVDLWKRGLVPSFDGKIWQLRSGEEAEVVWEGAP